MTKQTPFIFSWNVDGAPVRMGEPVLILPTMQSGSLDERFLGRRGVVVALVYDEPGRQYPHEPLVQVRVEDLGEDLFFPWELKRCGAPSWCPFTGPGGAPPPSPHGYS